ncbi:MAG: DUF4424 domain-containing protein [Planctomycetales bacterium]|nr:DUF4424 domain-containing protein [Planctomycetales bacterium]
MRRLAAVLPALALLAASSDGRADLAPEPQFGESLSPRKPTEVAMREETVRIRLERDRATVRAEFVLENTGPATTLEVGFPDVVYPAEHAADGPPVGLSGVMLQAFRVRVDGAPAPVTYRHVPVGESREAHDSARQRIASLRERIRAERDPERAADLRGELAGEEKRISGPGAEKDWAFRGWLVWTMTFREAERRAVAVSYWVSYEGWKEAGPLNERRFRYILRTGAGWKGAIGRAQVLVSFDEGVSLRQVRRAEPPPGTRGESGLGWDLRDFEPDRDIELLVAEHADLAEAAAVYLAEAEAAEAEGRRGEAQSHRAMAARCQEDAGLFAECLATCRKIVAKEREARARGGTERDALDVAYAAVDITPFFKAAYEPWECAIARCLRKLGRVAEAREAAAAALEAIEGVLGRETPRHDRDALEKRREELRASLGASAR